MRLTKYGHSCVRIERDGAALVGTASTLDRLGAAGLHDGILNDRGLKIVNAHLARLSGTDYAWLQPGTTIN